MAPFPLPCIHVHSSFSFVAVESCAGVQSQIRRYKIMNPEKLRSSYGKLIYLLQDAASEDMVELLGFNIVAPIKTV